MPPFIRLLPPFAAGRRSYSFFSNKSGGGRYFTAAKSSKTIAPSTHSTQPTASTTNKQPSTVDTAGAEHPDRSEQIPQPTADSTEYEASSPATPSPSPLSSRLSHPILKAHEFKLHHFFALHRPCLLLNQPTAALFESVSPAAPPPPAVATIDNPPEASADADADAARQLSRALVINRVGNVMNWDAALKRLGSDVMDGVGFVGQKSAGVVLDSTKRKRRRKMKKHKLKKRRRLGRSSRLRMGK